MTATFTDPAAPAARSRRLPPQGTFMVWTDGACWPNPGPGGWGYIIRRPSSAVIEASGGASAATNNRMELTAVLEALRALPDGAKVIVHSDSTYVVKGMSIWRNAWRQRGWRKKNGEPIPNDDLWQELDRQALRVRATFVWVRGHDGNEGNERADRLAALGRASVLARPRRIAQGVRA